MNYKHADILKNMTVEEKAAILSGAGEWASRGVKRLDIPGFIMSDGPHGLRRQAGAGDHLGLNASLPATCFPTAATVANSWDEQLGEEIGKALSEEAQEFGVDILLGPGLNMKRSPLCGRNFEYFSEDPYLAGKMAAAYIRGIQQCGIYACPKHFAVNSQETRRMASDSAVDERTLREIYLTGFEIAVKEGHPKAIMSAYNAVNGVYANESEHLLTDILRKEWGFDGIVISDWGGSNDHVAGVRAGSDLEMPGCGWESTAEVVRAVKNGSLSEEALDQRADEMLDAMLHLCEVRQAAHGGQREAGATGGGFAPFDRTAHHALARRAAAASAVLLKNEGQLLPLKKGARVAVIGDFALTPRYQGAGSSLVNATQVDTVAEVIQDYGDDLDVVGVCAGYPRVGASDAGMQHEAVELAKQADTVLFFFGLNEVSESEGGDRAHMRLPACQVELLERIAAVNQNVVGILSAGSPVEMPWEGRCRALLHGYLTGQAGAGAMLDILTGRVNPSGRLNETYARAYADTPTADRYPADQRISLYREGPYIGYRYYVTSQTPVQYPFGFGLSYTSFAYENLQVTEEGVRCTVKNTGAVAGTEVVQLYVGKADAAVFRPARELKGFARVTLGPGEAREVCIPFDAYTFRYWNVETNRFEVEGGDYQIMVGASALDIRLTAVHRVQGSGAPCPYDRERLAPYYSGQVRDVPDAAFAALLGHPIPERSQTGKLDWNDTFSDLRRCRGPIGRLVYAILAGIKRRSEQKGIPSLNAMFIFNMPFRGLTKMSGGAVNRWMAQGLLDIFNFRFFTGLGRFIAGLVRNMYIHFRFRKL